MNYGKIEDWEKYDHLGYICESCESIKVKWSNGDLALCDKCYISYVILPNTEPIGEVTEALIGREVVCVSDDEVLLKFGENHMITDIVDGFINLEILEIHENINFWAGFFRLLPETNVSAVIKDEMTETFDSEKYEDTIKAIRSGKKALIKDAVDLPKETTHSGTLEFPNGERIIIPGPGPGWKGEETRYDWPHLHELKKIRLLGEKINHHRGILIIREYYNRALTENPRIVSITKWTRDPNWKPEPREETFEERAVRNYPSRWRE